MYQQFILIITNLIKWGAHYLKCIIRSIGLFLLYIYIILNIIIKTKNINDEKKVRSRGMSYET